MPRCLASQPRGGSGPKYLAAFRPQHLSSSLELRHVRQALHESSAALAVSASLQPLDCIACQAPPSVGFSRQECWSGLPLPSPGDLPDPGIEPTSLTSPALAGGFFTSSAAWDPLSTQSWHQIPQVKGLVPKDHHTSDALCKSESPVLLTIRL